MANSVGFQVIAHIRNDFSEKFGVPRQSGLVETPARIVFEPAFRVPEALRGIEGYSHLWLIWQFSEAARQTWSPTVRPPRLGGNTRMGVFATRSPFRPNPIGLSSVRLDRVEWQSADGPVLHISGADLIDGTPIYDIKPYLPYTDAHPDARGGFARGFDEPKLTVVLPPDAEEALPASLREPVRALLAEDPRPAYQDDPTRVYQMAFGGYDIGFTVCGETLTVNSVKKRPE